MACSRVEPPMASVVASEQQGASEDVLHEPIIYLGSPAQPRIELSGQLPSPQPAEQQQPQEPEQKEQHQSPQERKAAGDQRPHSHRTVPQGNNCVFFAKVPPFVQEEQLLELFTRCGAVVGINLYRSWATTKKSKGCGIVEFVTAEGAAVALEQLNGAHLWPECPGPMVVERLHRGRPVMLPSTLKTHPRFGPSAQAIRGQGAQLSSAAAAAAGTRAKQPMTVRRYMPLSEQQEGQAQRPSDPPGLGGSSFPASSATSSAAARYPGAHTPLGGQGLDEGGQQQVLLAPAPLPQQPSFLYSPDSAAASLQAISLQPPPQAPPGLQYIAVPAGMSVQVTLQPQAATQSAPAAAYVLQAPPAQQVVTLPAAAPGASFLYRGGTPLVPQVLGDGSGLTVLGGPTLQGMDPHHHHPQQQQQQYFTLPGGMPMLQPGSTGQQLLAVSQAGHHMGPSPEPQQVVMVSRGDPSGLQPGAPSWLMAMPQLPVGLNGAVGAGGQQVVVLGQPGQG